MSPERSLGGVRVVFNHDDRISGLFVLLPDAP
jgi:hypothetical protein